MRTYVFQTPVQFAVNAPDREAAVAAAQKVLGTIGICLVSLAPLPDYLVDRVDDVGPDIAELDANAIVYEEDCR